MRTDKAVDLPEEIACLGIWKEKSTELGDGLCQIKSDYYRFIDPMTLGHLDLIERASRLFDRLYVGIFFNHERRVFTIEQREAIVTEAVAHLPNVRVITSEAELAVEVARRVWVTSLVEVLLMARTSSMKAIWTTSSTNWLRA